MGSLREIIVVPVGAIALCGLYSALDMKYGEKGCYGWSAFCLLIIVLGGGAVRGTVAAALMIGGVMGGVEPFAALFVSVLASKVLFSNMCSESVDDVQVNRKPYEEEIRELLFVNDPSRLHLVDAELRKYRGREKQLLRKYKAEFAPSPRIAASIYAVGRQTTGIGRGWTGGDGGGDTRMGQDDSALVPKGVLEKAREEEAMRVQASLESSLRRIRRKADQR